MITRAAMRLSDILTRENRLEITPSLLVGISLERIAALFYRMCLKNAPTRCTARSWTPSEAVSSQSSPPITPSFTAYYAYARVRSLSLPRYATCMPAGGRDNCKTMQRCSRHRDTHTLVANFNADYSLGYVRFHRGFLDSLGVSAYRLYFF
jgi:hypothetical protein